MSNDERQSGPEGTTPAGDEAAWCQCHDGSPLCPKCDADLMAARKRDKRRFANNSDRCQDCGWIEACQCGTRWTTPSRSGRPDPGEDAGAAEHWTDAYLAEQRGDWTGQYIAQQRAARASERERREDREVEPMCPPSTPVEVYRVWRSLDAMRAEQTVPPGLRAKLGELADALALDAAAPAAPSSATTEGADTGADVEAERVRLVRDRAIDFAASLLDAYDGDGIDHKDARRARVELDRLRRMADSSPEREGQ